ncbi:hypothetical protein QJQ45_007819 [Haematococcus lacustris]|nr:hypothetical protein QJQ45_007819 [Haematococcus lacustris]
MEPPSAQQRAVPAQQINALALPSAVFELITSEAIRAGDGPNLNKASKACRIACLRTISNLSLNIDDMSYSGFLTHDNVMALRGRGLPMTLTLWQRRTHMDMKSRDVEMEETLSIDGMAVREMDMREAEREGGRIWMGVRMMAGLGVGEEGMGEEGAVEGGGGGGGGVGGEEGRGDVRAAALSGGPVFRRNSKGSKDKDALLTNELVYPDRPDVRMQDLTRHLCEFYIKAKPSDQQMKDVLELLDNCMGKGKTLLPSTTHRFYALIDALGRDEDQRDSIEPRSCIFLHGLEDTLSILLNRAAVKKWLLQRPVDPEPGSFAASPAAAHIRQHVTDAVYDHQYAVRVSLGLDWVSINKKSVGVIVMQLVDVPDHVRGKDDNWAILGVIIDNKTSADSHVTGYMKPIFEAFQGALGTDVSKHVHLRSEDLGDRPTVGPRLAAWSGGMQAGANMNCMWCWLSTPKHGKEGVHPMGYVEPVDAPTIPPAVRPPTPLAAGEAAPAKVHMMDACMRLTADEFKLRGDLVKAALEHGCQEHVGLKPGQHGCNRPALILEFLRYVEGTWVHVVPIAHSLLFGLVKNHLLWLLSTKENSPFDTHERKLIEERFKHIRVPVDYGRQPHHSDKCSGWIMDDYMNFLKHEWEYVFLDIMKRSTTNRRLHFELWEHLVQAVLHYLTPGADTPATVEANIQKGFQNLLDYAKKLEEHKVDLHVSAHMFSPNLHMCVCRLLYQELQRGRSFRDAEFWLERAMQYMKRWGGKHAPGSTIGLSACLREKVYRQAQRFLHKIRVLQGREDEEGGHQSQQGAEGEPLGSQQGGAGDGTRGLVERPNSGAGQVRAPTTMEDTQPEAERNCQLVGAGYCQCPVTGGEQWVRQAVCTMVGELNAGLNGEGSGWCEQDVLDLFSTPPATSGAPAQPPNVPGRVWYFTRAECTQQLMFSVAYKRAEKRNNSWAMDKYYYRASLSTVNEYAAHIQFWVRLEHPIIPGRFLRVAIARLFPVYPMGGLPNLMHGMGPEPEPPVAAAAAAARTRGRKRPAPQDTAAKRRATDPKPAAAAAEAAATSAAGAAVTEATAVGAGAPAAEATAGEAEAAAAAAPPAGAGPSVPPPHNGGASNRQRRSTRVAKGPAAIPQEQPTQATPPYHRRAKYRTKEAGAGPAEWFAVNGEQLHTLFVSFFPTGEGHGDMYFVPYNSLSKQH